MLLNWLFNRLFAAVVVGQADVIAGVPRLPRPVVQALAGLASHECQACPDNSWAPCTGRQPFPAHSRILVVPNNVDSELALTLLRMTPPLMANKKHDGLFFVVNDRPLDAFNDYSKRVNAVINQVLRGNVLGGEKTHLRSCHPFTALHQNEKTSPSRVSSRGRDGPSGHVPRVRVVVAWPATGLQRGRDLFQQPGVLKLACDKCVLGHGRGTAAKRLLTFDGHNAKLALLAGQQRVAVPIESGLAGNSHICRSPSQTRRHHGLS